MRRALILGAGFLAIACVAMVAACGEDGSSDESSPGIGGAAGEASGGAAGATSQGGAGLGGASQGGASQGGANHGGTNQGGANQGGGNQGGSAGQAGGAAGGAAGSGPATFQRITVTDKAAGPAFASLADMNGDGKTDIVVSHFGVISGLTMPDGEVRLYTQGATIDSWTETVLLPASAGYKFPNATTIADVDGDGDLDIILPAGFLACTANPLAGPCGALLWLDNTGSAFAVREIVEKGASLFYHHAEWVDFDGDGIKDLVTTGEEKGMWSSKAEAQWFKGTNTGVRFDTVPKSIGAGLGSFPTVVDIDGDNDLDVVSAEYFVDGGSFAWMERTSGMSFTRHTINNDSGPSIMLSLVPNLYGDGKLRAVGANHVNTAKTPPDKWPEAVLAFEIPADPKNPWSKTTITDGTPKSRPGSMMAPMGAPGIFGTGDMDGDGDIDVVLSGDGDVHVYWLEQTAPGVFATHILEDKLGQAGGLPIADLNGDGRNEAVVTGYEDNVVYIYVRK